MLTRRPAKRIGDNNATSVIEIDTNWPLSLARPFRQSHAETRRAPDALKIRQEKREKVENIKPQRDCVEWGAFGTKERNYAPRGIAPLLPMVHRNLDAITANPALAMGQAPASSRQRQRAKPQRRRRTEGGARKA